MGGHCDSFFQLFQNTAHGSWHRSGDRSGEIFANSKR